MKRDTLKSPSPSKMRLGLYGGSFDPIHNGHLRFAALSAHFFSLSRVVFVPDALSPHTYKTISLPYPHRVKMVEKAVEGIPLFGLHRYQDPSAPSYTKDLLEEYRRAIPEASLFFLLGSDAFLKILTWREGMELPRRVRFLVALRPGGREDLLRAFVEERVHLPLFTVESLEGAKALEEESREGVILFRHPSMVRLSSSQIREMAERRTPLHGLVPDGVRRYIEEKRLYTSEVES
ncbi:MAG TPA: nicotinate (nicotinamide) nucleotide adenylyltransferase [Candidatus Aminicenantes bacterium]|nr:nicotinate (nicotinamide) nucleotide adenylyltransferase [Candidatus Aminicenantes bacterium]